MDWWTKCLDTFILVSFLRKLINLISMICPKHKIRSFTLTIIKAQEKIKKLSVIRKLVLPFLNVQNTFQIYFMARLRQNIMIPTSKIIIMALHSMSLQTINSLFPPLKSWLYRTSNSHHRQCGWQPGMVNKMN